MGGRGVRRAPRDARRDRPRRRRRARLRLVEGHRSVAAEGAGGGRAQRRVLRDEDEELPVQLRDAAVHHGRSSTLIQQKHKQLSLAVPALCQLKKQHLVMTRFTF